NLNSLIAAHNDHFDSAVRFGAPDARKEFFFSTNRHAAKLDHDVALFDSRALRRFAVVKRLQLHAVHFGSGNRDSAGSVIVIPKLPSAGAAAIGAAQFVELILRDGGQLRFLRFTVAQVKHFDGLTSRRGAEQGHYVVFAFHHAAVNAGDDVATDQAGHVWGTARRFGIGGRDSGVGAPESIHAGISTARCGAGWG